MLQVKIEELDEAVILRCFGRLTSGYEGALLCRAVKRFGSNVIVDLSQIEAIDAAGIGALVSLQAAGIYLQLLNPSKVVREVLRLTRLDTVFEISASLPHGDEENDSVQHAMERFSPPQRIALQTPV